MGKISDIDIRDLPVNRIINGGFDFWQRGTVFNHSSLGAYSVDRFYLLTGYCNLAGNSFSNSDSAYSAFIQPGIIASGYPFLFLQKMEANMIQDLIGKKVMVSFKVKGSTTGTIVHRSFYSSGSGNGSFDWQEIDITTQEQTVYLEVDYSALSSLTNLSHVESCLDIQALSDWATQSGIDYPGGMSHPTYTGTLEISDWMVYDAKHGKISFQRAGRNYPEELQLCQRYYEKSYPINVPPGTSRSGAEAGLRLAIGHNNLVDAMTNTEFKVNKRVIPSIAIYSYLGNINKVNNGVSTSEAAGTWFATRADTHGLITVSSGGNVVTSNRYWFCWIADAEL